MSSKKSNKLKTPERDLKQEMSWKNNLFARYMLFRYSLALFFFCKRLLDNALTL